MSLWLLPLLIVGVSAVGDPGRIVPGLDRRRPLSRAGLAALVRAAAGHRSAELETVRAVPVVVQHRHVRGEVCAAGVTAVRPRISQSERQKDACAYNHL